MSTIAGATQNQPQPLFIECNGAPYSDQDESSIEINKMSPIFDYDDDDSAQYNYERRICGDVGNEQTVKEENASGVNDNVYLGRKNNSSLPTINDGLSASKEITQTSSAPVTSPTDNTDLYVPVEVQKGTILNVIKNVLVPVQGVDGSVSYELKNIGVRLNTEMKKPVQQPMNSTVISPTLPESAPIKEEDGSPEETDVCKTLKGVESTGPDEENLIKTEKEESEEVSMTGTTEGETIKNLLSVCHSCCKRFASEHLMMRHFSKMHKNHYRCKICEYIYESKDILEEHSKFHEGKFIMLNCPSCDKKYKYQWSLKRHLIRQHSIVEPEAIRNENDEASVADDECQIINRRYKKRYSCRYCDNAYLEYSYLLAHERLTHGMQNRGPKKFKCKLCTKRFRNESNLRRHIKFHERSYDCDICGMDFRTKQSVRMHMRKHTGEKPYKCKICLRSYAQLSVLRVHMLTHTGEKPYLCNICGKGFSQRCSLMVHHRKHPGNHPPPPRVSLSGLEANVN